MITPRDHFIVANRLTHHLVEWEGDGPVVILLHGFLEHARVWDWVAPRMAAAGHRVLALDWRGHGDTQWVGAGGYYHFADYVADLDGVVCALGGRALLVAHSMGGNAAALYAGAEPARVGALALIEGVGPPDEDFTEAPARYAGWFADLRGAGMRPGPVRNLEDAVARLDERYTRLSPEAIAHLARSGTRATEGGLTWKFDPLHRTRSPQPFYIEQARAFWRRVQCPVLYVAGDESLLRLPDDDLDDRLATLRAQRATIAGSGHHPHLEQPEALADVLIGFLRGK